MICDMKKGERKGVDLEKSYRTEFQHKIKIQQKIRHQEKKMTSKTLPQLNRIVKSVKEEVICLVITSSFISIL
jgi:hypothetical protein